MIKIGDLAKICNVSTQTFWYDDLKNAFNKDIDVVTLQSLQQKSTARRSPEFIQNVTNEMVKIYG